MDEKKSPDKKDFRDKAIKNESRKLKVRGKNQMNAWWGFGLFGLVGWSVIVPALIGVFLGLLLDHQEKSSHKWTLSLMLAGLFFGCLLALLMLAKEMFKNEDD